MNKLNHIIFIALDGCRYDSFIDAMPKTQKHFKIEKRYTCGSWSVPSLASLLTGMLPFKLKKGPHTTLTQDIKIWQKMIGSDFKYSSKKWIPSILQDQFDYYTLGLSSTPHFTSRSALRDGFDQIIFKKDFSLQEKINIAISTMRKSRLFCFMLTHETHYPYGRKELEEGKQRLRKFNIRKYQIESLNNVFPALDNMIGRLPKNTWVIVTADHGEVFGEDGMFGHGHQIHKKVFEVPFVRFQI